MVEKVGTTLDQFTSSLTTLASTIKDLSADQRSQGTQQLDVLKGIHYEIQDSKKILDHVRFQYAHHEQGDEKQTQPGK